MESSKLLTDGDNTDKDKGNVNNQDYVNHNNNNNNTVSTATDKGKDNKLHPTHSCKSRRKSTCITDNEISAVAQSFKRWFVCLQVVLSLYTILIVAYVSSLFILAS